MADKLSRRQFLQGLAMTGGTAILASCAPATPEVIEEEVVVKETVVVEVAGTPEVREVERVVTATPPPKEPVTVHFTHMGSPEVYEPIAPDMVRERLTGIELVIDKSPFLGSWDAYADNLIVRIAGGEGLDLMYMAIEGLALLSDRNIIQPLDPFIEVDQEAKEDLDADVHPTLTSVLTYRGNLWMLPFVWNNMIHYYNYKIFEEKGVDEPAWDWSWDDFLETCLQIADVKGTEDDLYAYSFWDMAFGICAWYFNNDTSWLTDDWTDSNLDDPKVAEVWQFLADLILKHKAAPNPAGWDWRAQFIAGHSAMISCGGWCMGFCRNSDFTDYQFQYYPHKAGPLKTVIGVSGTCIATMSPHPDEAWEVVKILNTPEIHLNQIVTSGSLPGRTSVAQSEEFLNLAKPGTADMSIFFESLDYADTVPSPPNYNVVDPLLRRWYSQVWNGELGVEEALAGAHEELQAEMDQLKE